MDHVDHILVVDDDHGIRTGVVDYLRKNGLRASAAVDGRDMFAQLDTSAFDLIVLDIMMPGDDGLVLCRTLRGGKHRAVPILLLTARDDETDRIIGLEMGADDYLTKPFNPRELLARIRAVLRRQGDSLVPPEAKVFVFAGWQLDAGNRHLTSPDGARTTLTSAEFDLLHALCEHAGRVLSRDKLLEITQGRMTDALERSIDVLISRLRRKMERDPREPELIRTIRSGGYLFAPDVARR
jgi:two-component system, OmpR family, response regulator